MRINIFGIMQKYNISGGRIYSWFLAEALAISGYEVEYITNHKPAFYHDFQDFSKVKLNINIIYPKTNRLINKIFKKLDFEITPKIRMKNITRADFAIIVPQLGNYKLHKKLLKVAQQTSDKLVLINFETPNWFNSLSIIKRTEDMWKGANRIAKYANIILSISKEGQKFAEEYYKDLKNHIQFRYFYTPINHSIADRIKDVKNRKRQLVCISRLDYHKGLNDIINMISTNIKNSTIILIIGSGKISTDFFNKLNKKASDFKVKLVIKYKISEHDKFKIIKESSAMVFPSYFEGFGMPPLESLYCQTPVVAYDLQVLREYGKNNILFVPMGNHKKLGEVAGEILEDPENYIRMIDKDYINNIARIDAKKDVLNNIFKYDLA